MRVFKFGGASVKDSASVRNIPAILSKYEGEKLVIVLSAMGKTTNALERLAEEAFRGHAGTEKIFEGLMQYHLNIAYDLFPDEKHDIFTQLSGLSARLRNWIDEADNRNIEFDMYYDQVVPYGELMSTSILSSFLAAEGIKVTLLDARELVITDSSFRAALVNWDISSMKIRKAVIPEIEKDNIVITQGFIGSDMHHSTSLGREGSDFSAAIFANILDAEEVIVWKDVPGYLNADPKYFDHTVKFDRLSYMECIELAFYGAKIIHPKTIRPLKSKNIPLLVKSFLDPELPGSVIHEDHSSDTLVPAFIVKEDQVLISISSRDFSFIGQGHLYSIFGLFTKHRTNINLMQNSAISFSVCVDMSHRLAGLMAELQNEFRVKFNEGLKMITIRHYDQKAVDMLTADKEVLLEQRSRITVQMVIK